MKLIAVLLGTVALTLAFGVSALAERNYTDPVGDAPNGLDITAVTVANDVVKNTITFRVSVANAPPTVAADDEYDIFVDADQDPATGDPSWAGADYLFYIVSGGYVFAKWSASDQTWNRIDADFTVRVGTGGFAWRLNPQDIGSPPAFNFVVATAVRNPSDSDNPFTDRAPDADSAYSYTLDAPPPTVKSVAPIVSGSGEAGTTYVVRSLTANLSNGTTADATNLRCTATLGGVDFRGTGKGACTFKLPKGAKGKTLVVHITGTVGPTNVGSRKTVRVR
jgi:hypothetical protein